MWTLDLSQSLSLSHLSFYLCLYVCVLFYHTLSFSISYTEQYLHRAGI